MERAGRGASAGGHGGHRNLIRAPNGDMVAPCLVEPIDLLGGARAGADVPVVHRPTLEVEWFEPEQPAIVRLELRTKPRMRFLHG